MRNEFTAIIERDGEWFIAYCAEVPGANGQGKTHEECVASLRQAIALMAGDPEGGFSSRSAAERELVVVE